jgi:hypothetical protein
LRPYICWTAILVVAAIPGAAQGQNLHEAALTKPSLLNFAKDSSSFPANYSYRREEHRFWDRENDWLFAGVAASRTLDYFSTLNMRRRGRQEIFLNNETVDNHAEFAVIEAAATGVSIGASYIFHRTGHHKLERWTSIVHFGLATTGAVRNYCLKTAH